MTALLGSMKIKMLFSNKTISLHRLDIKPYLNITAPYKDLIFHTTIRSIHRELFRQLTFVYGDNLNSSILKTLHSMKYHCTVKETRNHDSKILFTVAIPLFKSTIKFLAVSVGEPGSNYKINYVETNFGVDRKAPKADLSITYIQSEKHLIDRCKPVYDLIKNSEEFKKSLWGALTYYNQIEDINGVGRTSYVRHMSASEVFFKLYLTKALSYGQLLLNTPDGLINAASVDFYTYKTSRKDQIYTLFCNEIGLEIIYNDSQNKVVCFIMDGHRYNIQAKSR